MTTLGANNTTAPSLRLRAWWVWGLAAAAFGFGFFMRVSPSAMVDNLMRDFAVGGAVLGNLSAIYFYIYAGSQIPIGALMDRWGPRLMISASVAISAIGTVVFAIAPSVEAAYVGRFLVGAGSACAFVGSLTLAAAWFPANRFAYLSGLTMFAGMSGGVLGQAPLAQLVSLVGWRTTMLGAAGFAAALALLIWLVVRDAPTNATAPPRRKATSHDLARSILAAVRSPRICAIAIMAASFTGLLLAYGGLWGVPYLMTRYGLERPEAAFFVTFNLLGFAIGAPAGGWLSDRIGRRKLPLVVACLSNIICLSVMFYTDISLYFSTALIFTTGFMSGGMIVCFALARELTPPGVHGAATGFINTGAVGAGAVLQPLIGLLLDWQWDGTIVDGVRQYTVSAYNTAFGSLLAWAVMGFLCLLFIRETYCHPYEE